MRNERSPLSSGLEPLVSVYGAPSTSACGIARSGLAEQHGTKLEATGLTGGCGIGDSAPNRPPPGTAQGTGREFRVTPAPEPDDLITTVEGTDASDVPDSDAAWDIVDQWGAQSFPVSDPPSNW